MLDIGTNGEMALENPVRMCAVRQRQDRLLKERRSPWECRQLPERSLKVWLEDGKICCSTINDAPAVENLRFRVDRRTGGIFETELLDETGLIADDVRWRKHMPVIWER